MFLREDFSPFVEVSFPFSAALAGATATTPDPLGGRSFRSRICAFINFSDHSILHFTSSLILLGVGWNFLYVGATTLLSYQIHVEDQPKAQALNDFLVTASAALSVAVSGRLHEVLGWVNLNLIAVPITVLGIILILRKNKLP